MWEKVWLRNYYLLLRHRQVVFEIMKPKRHELRTILSCLWSFIVVL